jgi:hypothetical protein
MNDEDFKKLEAAYNEGDLDAERVWEHFVRARKEGARAESSVAYAFAVLGKHDNYGSGDLDVVAREVSRQLQEKDARIDELLREATAHENDRRYWKSRALALRQLLDALTSMMLSWYGETAAVREAAEKIAEVAKRNDELEADAWSKVASLAREFVKDCEAPMMDYAPDVVTPLTLLGHRGVLDPIRAFVERWHGRFKSALE